MAAPSKSFTIVTDARVDADSPMDETLWEDFRDNDINLEEWLGKNYTPAVDHDHDGVNSAPLGWVVSSDGSQVIADGASWVPVEGIYNIGNAGAVDSVFQIFVSGVWQGAGTVAGVYGTIICDGTNMRIDNPAGGAGSTTFWWQKF